MSTNFPTSLDSFATLVDNTDDALASHQNDRADAIEALEAKVGVDSSAVTTSLDYKVNNFFATGRKVYLYENTAPTGWSITAVTDKVLAVKGGAQAYNVNGGNTAGTWTQPSHTLTSAESGVPAHSHPYTTAVGAAAGTWYPSGVPNATTGIANTNNNTAANAASAHNHGTAYRPSAAVGIICTKS